MSAAKRQRTSNFMPQEKDILLSLFEKYRSTLENKKTDGASIEEKNKAWELLTLHFNSVSPSHEPRSVESLKIYYKNLKKCLRKKAGEYRKQTYLTGGGPPPTDLTKDEEKLLSIISTKTVFGTNNPFDSDGLKASHESVTLDNTDDIEEINSEEVFRDPKSDWKRHKPSDLKRPLNGKLIGIRDHTAHNSNRIELVYMKDNSPDDAHPFIQSIQPSMSNEHLQEEAMVKSVSQVESKDNNDHSTPQTERKKTVTPSVTPRNSNRRRPTTIFKTLTSSALGAKYEALADKKLELVNCLEKEHQLRLRALELDIKLKEKQLNSV